MSGEEDELFYPISETIEFKVESENFSAGGLSNILGTIVNITGTIDTLKNELLEDSVEEGEKSCDTNNESEILDGSMDLFDEGVDSFMSRSELETDQNLDGSMDLFEEGVDSFMSRSELETDPNLDGSMDLFEEDQADRPTSLTKECPICKKKVKHFSTHLKHHPLAEDEVQAICYQFRRRRTTKINPRLLKPCPVHECLKLLPHARIDKHLRRHHKITRGDTIYDRTIKEKNYINKRNTVGIKTKDNHKVNKVIEEECHKFCTYLKLPYGGGAKPNVARQQSLKLRQLLYGVEFSHRNDYKDPNFIVKFQGFLETFSSSHCGKSIGTYLSIFVTYLTFLKKLKFLPSEVASDLIDFIKPIKKSYKKVAPSTLHEAEEEISQEDIAAFESSACYKETVALIKSFNDDKKKSISTHDHAICRGLLLTMALFRNCSRSCNLYNMKVSQLVNAVQMPDGYVIQVSEHKTFDTHGAADVVLNRDIYKLFIIYKDFIRPLIKNFSSHDYLFVTWSGKQITPTDLSNSIKGPWCSSGMTKKLGANIIRKTVTTRIHLENDSKKKEQCATHLRHHLSTAETFYKFKSRPARSVAAAKMIRSTLGGEWQDDKEKDTDFEPSDSPTPNSECSSSETELPAGCSRLDVEQTLKKPKGRCFYNENERTILRAIFYDYIKQWEVPKLAKIREITGTDFRCQHLSDEKLVPTKIKGALQNFINKEKRGVK